MANLLVYYFLTCYTLILHLVYVNCAMYIKIKIWTLVDLGEGPGGPASPLIFRPNWGFKGWIHFFGDRPLPPTPPPPLSQGLDPALFKLNLCWVNEPQTPFNPETGTLTHAWFHWQAILILHLDQKAVRCTT